jgi:hypothetical protein
LLDEEFDVSVSEPHIEIGFWAALADINIKNPDKIFVCDERGRSFSFHSFYKLTEKVAAGLYRLGVRPDSKVVWVLPNWIETLVVAAALDRLGAVQLPFTPSVEVNDLLFICEQQQPELLILPSNWRDIEYGSLAAGLQRELEDLWVLYIEKKCLPTGLTLPILRKEDYFKGRWIFYSRSKQCLIPGKSWTIDELFLSADNFIGGMRASPCGSISMMFPLCHSVGVSCLFAIILANRECLIIE